MSEFDKNMEKIFDVTPMPAEEKKTLLPAVKKEDEPDLSGDLKDAYEQTKDNLQELIDNGKDAMEELIQIAKAGQHPRAFEVYATLLKNVVDANKELLSVQKQMRTMDGKQSAGDTKIDKAIFVGTTDQLNKMLGKQ
jgi:gas vesicle protein